MWKMLAFTWNCGKNKQISYDMPEMLRQYSRKWRMQDIRLRILLSVVILYAKETFWWKLLMYKYSSISLYFTRYVIFTIFLQGNCKSKLTLYFFQMYLRTWACELGVPILSIDYSLAPEAPFPRAFEECFFVYAWCLNNFHQLGTTGKCICLAGDSAG